MNLLTVDVEDWFQVFYGEHLVPRERWDVQEPRIEKMLASVLSLFGEHRVHATFFFVGWLAERYPHLVRQVSNEGHEIASHSYWHQEVSRLDPARFMAELERAKVALEDACSQPVLGFRSPGYSIHAGMGWALDAIAAVGHTYDCSLLGPWREPYEIREGLLEIPQNAVGIGRRFLPTNGGFFFRATPYALFRDYVRRLNRSGRRLVFYTHTWEILTDYPRLPLGGTKGWVQYHNLGSVRNKLARLLEDFRFTSIGRGLELPGA